MSDIPIVRAWKALRAAFLAYVDATEKRRLPENQTITIEDNAIEVRMEKSGNLVYALPLGDVVEINAYKRDLWTTDEVRCQIVIRGEDKDSYRTLNEEMPGFDALLDYFAAAPGGTGPWWEKVVKPAFETNWTLIYRNPALAAAETAPLESQGAT